jgi:hypothetical protein
VIWLTGKLMPDHKTIANFRRDNRAAIRQVYRSSTRFCRELDLFIGKLVAIDGSKFKAFNNKDRYFTDRRLKRATKDIDKKIDAYPDELDENDIMEPDEHKPSAEELKEKIQRLKERMKKYKELKKKDGGCRGNTDLSHRSGQPIHALGGWTQNSGGLQCPDQCRREARTHP